MLKLGTYGPSFACNSDRAGHFGQSTLPTLIYTVGVLCLIGIIYGRAGRLGAEGH